jgi:hypothetical protein
MALFKASVHVTTTGATQTIRCDSHHTHSRSRQQAASCASWSLAASGKGGLNLYHDPSNSSRACYDFLAFPLCPWGFLSCSFVVKVLVFLAAFASFAVNGFWLWLCYALYAGSALMDAKERNGRRLYGTITAAPSMESLLSAARASLDSSSGNTVTLGRRLISLAI